MRDIHELRRVRTPFLRPQSISFDGPSVWATSIESRRLYQLDPEAWTVRGSWETPGTPWGMTAAGAELRLVCGEGEDDARYLRRFVPGRGFDGDFRVPCPDLCGSQLGWDGKTLHLNQWNARRVLALDAEGSIRREWPVPHQPTGQAIVDGAIYLVTTEEEEKGDYWLTRLDPATGATADLARIPFQARGLAFDGRNFWTNHRERHEAVCFARP